MLIALAVTVACQLVSTSPQLVSSREATPNCLNDSVNSADGDDAQSSPRLKATCALWSLNQPPTPTPAALALALNPDSSYTGGGGRGGWAEQGWVGRGCEVAVERERGARAQG